VCHKGDGTDLMRLAEGNVFGESAVKGEHEQQVSDETRPLAFTRYCFTSKLYCGVNHPFLLSSPYLESLPYCNTIAWPLRNLHPPPTPPFMPYTIQYWGWQCLVKAKEACRSLSPIWVKYPNIDTVFV